MSTLSQQIQEQKLLFRQELNSAINKEDLEKVRIKFLGRQGSITELLNKLKELPTEEKREFGPILNNLKKEAQNLITQKLEQLQPQNNNQENLADFDISAYVPQSNKGSLHPYTIILNELEPIFLSMGFEIVQGPELESELHNFDVLNIPQDHPARDIQDTFWINIPNMLMRTHTSAVQAHQLKKRKPPLALIAPGRVYRNEATDASHDVMFMQLEGLVVDKNISVAQLLGTVKYMFQSIFKSKKLETRVRTSYFPFVEPGIEFDITCPFCTDGCSICKKSRWIEGGGAGLIHPNVLDFCGINSKEFSGFAFGFGLTRLVMMKLGITDIRLLHSNKIDFLKQF